MQITGIILIILNAIALLAFFVLVIIFTIKTVIFERTRKQKNTKEV